MKPYKINIFRLGLLLFSYLIFNVVYSITYDSGGFAFIILWPAFFASYAGIVLGNIFIFRDISKLKASFEDNELIQKTCTIQLVLATIGFFMQIIGFKGAAPLNFLDNYPLIVCASIVYSIILLIGIYQTIKLGQGKDTLAILGFIFGVTVILYTCIALLTTSSYSPSIKSTTPSFAEEFQSLGLKGKVEVIDQHREIEMFNGTIYELRYTENLSDGTILKKYTDAKIHKMNGEHLSNFFLLSGTDLETLLNDKEKALFTTVKQDEFSFLLDVYRERPNLQQEEDSIKNTTADKINKLFDTPGKIASSFEFGKYPIENYYVAMIKQAVSNREKGDSDAAGFYNITTKDLIKNKGLTLDFDCDLTKIKVENGSPLDAFKEKILSLPKNSFSDGIYNISCSYDENGIKKKVTCPFVVEDGVGHFEEDEIEGNQTN